jgi:hypothetical protein
MFYFVYLGNLMMLQVSLIHHWMQVYLIHHWIQENHQVLAIFECLALPVEYYKICFVLQIVYYKYL